MIYLLHIKSYLIGTERQKNKVTPSDRRIDLILLLLELLYLCGQVSSYGQILTTKPADRENTLLNKLNCEVNDLMKEGG